MATKVYIGQPMRGRERSQILAERERVKAAVLQWYPDAEFLDTYFEDYDETKGELYWLSKSIALMNEADLVVMAPMYLGTPGCECEDHIAQVYGKHRFTINYGFDLNGNYDNTTDEYMYVR